MPSQVSTRVVPIVRPTPHALVPAALPSNIGNLKALTVLNVEENNLQGKRMRSTNSPLIVVPGQRCRPRSAI